MDIRIRIASMPLLNASNITRQIQYLPTFPERLSQITKYVSKEFIHLQRESFEIRDLIICSFENEEITSERHFLLVLKRKWCSAGDTISMFRTVYWVDINIDVLCRETVYRVAFRLYGFICVCVRMCVCYI